MSNISNFRITRNGSATDYNLTDSAARESLEYNGLAVPLSGWQTGKCVRTDGDTIGSPRSETGYRYLVTPCQSGDVFIFNTVASESSYTSSFAFTASDGTILYKSSYRTNYVDYHYTAPEGAAYLYINDKNGSGTCYKNTGLLKRFDDLESALSYNRLAVPLTGWRNGELIRTEGDTIGNRYINADYRCLVTPCREGDVFILNTIASDSFHAANFAFTAVDGTILYKSRYTTNCVEYYCIAPEGSAYLYINDKNGGGTCYKNVGIETLNDNIKTAISTAKGINVLPMFGLDRLALIRNGITYSRVNGRTIHVSGTTDSNASHTQIMVIDASNKYLFEPENKLKISLASSDSIYIYIGYEFTDSSTSSERIWQSGTVQLPDNLTQAVIRLIVSSNSTVDEDVTVEIMAHPETAGGATAEEPTLKVLCIGNSFTSDATAYAPALMKSIANVPVVMAKTYYSGARIPQYTEWLDNESAVLSYHKYDPGTQAWRNGEVNKTLQQIITDEDWDIITFSPGSNQGISDLNTITYRDVNELIYKVLDYYASVHPAKGVKVGWLMPQMRPRTVSRFTYQQLVAFMQDIMDNCPIDFLIPSVTAIENARTTSLDSLGDYGSLAVDDTGHLQAGIPTLVSCYTTAVSILALMGKSYHGILKNPIRPTDDWITSQNSFHHGNSAGVTADNCYLAQKCVIAAMKKPYTVTTIPEDEIPSA